MWAPWDRHLKFKVFLCFLSFYSSRCAFLSPSVIMTAFLTEEAECLFGWSGCGGRQILSVDHNSRKRLIRKHKLWKHTHTAQLSLRRTQPTIRREQAVSQSCNTHWNTKLALFHIQVQVLCGRRDVLEACLFLRAINSLWYRTAVSNHSRKAWGHRHGDSSVHIDKL